MSDEKLFKIRTGSKPTDVKDHPYEEEFEMFGEVWVVHRRLYGIGFALSHKATGMRVPKSERERAVESRFHGIQFLTENQTQLAKVLEEAVKA